MENTFNFEPPLSQATSTPETRDKSLTNQNKMKRHHLLDLSVDSLSQSNASSIHEPSDFGSISSMDESTAECLGNESSSTLGLSHFSLEQLREKYKKEFKAAIKDSYKYMMNQDIVESCKLTEGELSAFESDDMIYDSNLVSYNEFVKQYTDLIEWLKCIHEQINQTHPVCLSEKYLNQAYHEELLHRLTRRTLFNEYAAQLIKKYPAMKEDITVRQRHVDDLWTNLEKIVSSDNSENPLAVLKDIELDLFNFEKWLNDVDSHLKVLESQVSSGGVTKENMLETVLILVKEVQPKSKLVSSMVQMCDNLLGSSNGHTSSIIEDHISSAKNQARLLQHRWESLFINILEWQLKIEQNYLAKQRMKHGSMSGEFDSENALFEVEADSLGDLKDVENGCFAEIKSESVEELPDKNFLSSIDEDTEENDTSDLHSVSNHKLISNCQTQSLCGVTGDVIPCDVGYSSEGQQSQNEHVCKVGTEFKSERQTCCCNTGSDFSDSSGIGVSTTTESQVSKARCVSNEMMSSPVNVIDKKDSYFSECSKMKHCVEYDTSMPATEDEFSSDEMPPYFSAGNVDSSHSLELNNSIKSKLLHSFKDATVSDGEALTKTNKNPYVGTMQKHKALFHLNRNTGDDDSKKELSLSKKKKLSASFKKLLIKGSLMGAKKCPQKRRFGETISLYNSEGNLPVSAANDKIIFTKIRKVISCEDVNMFKTPVVRCEKVKKSDQSYEEITSGKQIITSGDQQVPEGYDDSIADQSSLQSEVEMSDEEFSFKSNVDMWLEDNIFGNPYASIFKHSTPKKIISRATACVHDAFESDSDIEDFKAMLEDSIKALNFTKNSVAQTVRLSNKILDPNELLEPLATCRTSIKCLTELERAVISAGRGTFDVLRLRDLIEDWATLESQILHHQESIKLLIMSAAEVLEKQISDCEDGLNSAELNVNEVNTQSLLSVIHCCKIEKEKLLDAQRNLDELLKSIAPLKCKRFNLQPSQCVDVFFKLEHLHKHCSSLLYKAGATLSSYLSVAEPYSKFCKMKHEMNELMKNSGEYLLKVATKNDKQALFGLMSLEAKVGWLKMTEKFEQMKSLVTNLSYPRVVYQSFQEDLNTIRLLLSTLQVRHESVINEVFTCEKLQSENLCNKEPRTTFRFDDALINSPQIVKKGDSRGLVRKIIQVGLPLSAAVLLFGWMYSHSGTLYKDVLGDWGIVLFPNLQHVRGRPPT